VGFTFIGHACGANRNYYFIDVEHARGSERLFRVFILLISVRLYDEMRSVMADDHSLIYAL
jgi:hypothetical protein